MESDNKQEERCCLILETVKWPVNHRHVWLPAPEVKTGATVLSGDSSEQEPLKATRFDHKRKTRLIREDRMNGLTAWSLTNGN